MSSRQLRYKLRAETQIPITKETSFHFSFVSRDVRIQTTRAGDFLSSENRQINYDDNVRFSTGLFSSYETLKQSLAAYMLSNPVEYISREQYKILGEYISRDVWDRFRNYEARKVKIWGFIVEIERRIFLQCDENRDLLEANMHMEPKMVPASKDSIHQLLLDTSKSEEEKKGEACSVCLGEFLVGFDEVKVLPCGHAFHGYCIITWLQKSHLCPLCRFAMPVDDAN